MKNIFKIALSILVLLHLSCYKDCDPASAILDDDAVTSGIKEVSFAMEPLINSDESPNPQCFVDLDAGKVYKLNEGLANAAKIDAVCTRTQNAKECILVGIANYKDYQNTAYPAASLLQGWSKLNKIILQKTTALSDLTEEFVAINAFNDLVQKNVVVDPNSVFVSVTDYYTSVSYTTLYFETNNNNKKRRGFLTTDYWQNTFPQKFNMKIKFEAVAK